MQRCKAEYEEYMLSHHKKFAQLFDDDQRVQQYLATSATERDVQFASFLQTTVILFGDSVGSTSSSRLNRLRDLRDSTLPEILEATRADFRDHMLREKHMLGEDHVRRHQAMSEYEHDTELLVFLRGFIKNLMMEV